MILLSGLATVEDHGSGESVVGAKGVEDNGTADVDRDERLLIEGAVEAVEEDFDDGQEDHLAEGDAADKGTKRDENSGGSEVTTDEVGDVEFDLVPAAGGTGVGFERLLHEVAAEDPPFDGDARNNHGVTDGGETVLSEEGHQVAKTDEDHDVNVLVQAVVSVVLFLGERQVVVIVGGEDTVEDTEDDLEDSESDSERVVSHFLLRSLKSFFVLRKICLKKKKKIDF